MKMSSTQARRYFQNLTTGNFKLEHVDSIIYMGSVVNNENKLWTDLHSKTMTANCARLAHIKCFRSKLLSWNTKL